MRFHSIFHFSILKTSLTLWRQQFRNQYSYQTSKLKQKSWITNERKKRDVPLKLTVIWIQMTIKRFSSIIRMHLWAAHRMSYSSSSEILQLHNSLFVQVQLFQYFRHSTNMKEKKITHRLTITWKKFIQQRKMHGNETTMHMKSWVYYCILFWFCFCFFFFRNAI